MSQPHADHHPSAAHATKETIKDTLVSVIIAFVLAFVFRGFVIEAFVIPTGSMAPTLMGAHMQFRGDQSGATWPVGPWDRSEVSRNEYRNPQGQTGATQPVFVHDPMTGRMPGGREQVDQPLRSGDRILVLKYLYELSEPKRFDVVVFKYPGEPGTNYIKRLVGLAGQQTALVDGDVFYRIPTGNPVEDAPTINLWKAAGWKVARKTADVTRGTWQCVFDSDFTPRDPLLDGVKPWFVSPWKAAGATAAEWKINDRRSYAFEGKGSGEISWVPLTPTPPPAGRASIGSGVDFAIDDRYPYDETPEPAKRFPVSDVCIRAGVEVPAGADGPRTASFNLTARGFNFRGVLDGATGKATVEMRAAGGDQSGAAEWKVLGSGTFKGLTPGTITNVEFWHIDQALSIWIAGKRVTDKGEYGDDASTPGGIWTPAKRIEYSTGRTLDDIAQSPPAGVSVSAMLFHPPLYRKPQVSLAFTGGPLVLHRVGLDRDLYYQPGPSRSSGAAWGTLPESTVTLNNNQFFVCGDNSPASSDGRLWDKGENEFQPRGNPDPWVAATVDNTVGIVPRELMLGKAFFVYFPALAGTKPIPMPDFGKLRFIR